MAERGGEGFSIRFHDAVRNVTGSKHLLEWDGERILLDCGLVQGRREESSRANRELPFDPGSIHHVVLSHAHIDHCGALPVLVKQGFRGKIWCTNATKDLTALLLEDSAHIQEADARWVNRKRDPGDRRIEPLYTKEDALKAARRLVGVPYRERVALSAKVGFELLDAGHILGSAMPVFELGKGDRTWRLAFTGDLGRPGMAILRDPATLPGVDYLVTESTYGGRKHTVREDLERELASIVHEEQKDGGRILIPAFAVGRTQALIYHLGRLRERKEVPPLRIFLDSPLARRATGIVSRHPEVFDGQARKMLEKGQDPFHFPGIRYIKDVEESKALNKSREPCIIIAASGMMEAGRILHHLEQSIGREEDCVLIVGYQARHTLGRRLLEKERTVRVFGKPRRVRCKVRKLNGFSAHADFGELMGSLRHLARGTRRAFVVHGDPEASEAVRDGLLGEGFGKVLVPEEGKAYAIGPTES